MNRKPLIIGAIVVFVVLVAYLIVAKPWQDGLVDGKKFDSGVSTTVKIGEALLEVEIADDPAERAQGLMFRNSLPEGQGMLFVFENLGYHSFWMRNTLIPLDIIWIADNRIVHIEKNVQPAGDAIVPQTYAPTQPASHVLEVNAGTVEKYGWKVGEKVKLLISND